MFDQRVVQNRSSILTLNTHIQICLLRTNTIIHEAGLQEHATAPGPWRPGEWISSVPGVDVQINILYIDLEICETLLAVVVYMPCHQICLQAVKLEFTQ